MNEIKLKKLETCYHIQLYCCSDCSFLFPDDIIRSGNGDSERVCG